MALNKEQYHHTGVPRVYCDYPSYLRAIGLQMGRHRKWAPSTARRAAQIGYQGWGMNPSKVVPQAMGNSTYFSSELSTAYAPDHILWGEEMNEDNYNINGNGIYDMIVRPMSIEVRKLIATSNYFGVLGHNLYSLNYPVVGPNLIYPRFEGSYTPNTNGTVIIGENNLWSGVDDEGQPFYERSGYGGDGTFLSGVSSWDAHVDEIAGYRMNYFFNVNSTNDNDAEDELEGKELIIGSNTIGRYFDFPHSPDMNVSVSVEYDGIKRKRTTGGTDLTQINYHKARDWGGFKPFTVSKNYEDYTDVGLNGRRRVQVSFSYLAEDKVFPKTIHENVFLDNYYTDGFSQTLADNLAINNNAKKYNETDNMLGNYLNVTLGGQLTHILQLDKDSHDFLLVKLNQKATKITQKGPRLYHCSLEFVETWD